MSIASLSFSLNFTEATTLKTIQTARQTKNAMNIKIEQKKMPATVTTTIVKQERMQNARVEHAKQKRLQDAVGFEPILLAAFGDNLKVSTDTGRRTQDTGHGYTCNCCIEHRQQSNFSFKTAQGLNATNPADCNTWGSE